MYRRFLPSRVAGAVLLGLFSMASHGQEQASAAKEADIERIQVSGSLGSLPGQDVEAVFGFGKSILETPRSASTISQEQLERFNVSDIDELVAFAPGTFTQSFFGVAGSLDVRGTPGETYFRGVKRLDNPGNYPTPIGASSRVDIVRGPASPIYGPAKIGGYLNFNPKSARASGGQYLTENTGQLSYTTGTWDKSVLTAEVGGPGTLAGKKFGFYLYGEVENSGSYYRNTNTDQTVLQASFDVDVNDKLRLEFGGMYHDFDGNQVAGWNRLTQDLIDNGTYVTGTAQPLDTNGDGSISHQEYDAANINPFIAPDATPLDSIGADFFDPIQGLENVGTTTLDGSQVLVAADDLLTNTVETLYFDVIYYTDSGWEVKNQLFYEAYENLNENAYGFSQFHDSWVVENKLIFAKEYDTDDMTAAVQVSPSIRFTDFKHGDDFINEYFDRRDLTQASSALDRRLLATRINDDYTTYSVGDYLDLGLAVLTDFTWDNGWNIVAGLRYDEVDIESFTPGELILVRTREGDSGEPIPDQRAQDTFDGVSWNLSLSYQSEFGLIPYITAAEQATIIAGQGAEIDADTIETGAAFDTSDLIEVGIKGSFLEDSLYFSLSVYEQERTDFRAQAIVTNATTKNTGTEFELRWVVNEQLVVSGGYTHLEVENVAALENGNQFGFFGAEDFPNLADPSVLYGGAAVGLIDVGDGEGLKAGIPENIYTLTATYDFQNGLAVNTSIVKADSTFSGFSNSVVLPAYTLVNAGLFYELDDWSFSLTVKNLTDERYFRSNFPDLFGGQIVLPELPRHYQAKVAYRF